MLLAVETILLTINYQQEHGVADKPRRFHLQSISHQQFDDESLGFMAEVGKHAFFKSHIIVSDVENRAAVIFSSKRRNSSETAKQSSLMKSN